MQLDRELRVSLLGPATVEVNKQPAQQPRLAKAMALLAFLVVEQQAHPRSALADLLWPQRSEQDARRNLSQTLTRIRKLIGDDAKQSIYFDINRQTIGVRPDAPLTCDASEFRQLLADVAQHEHITAATCELCQQRLKQAVGLVRGEWMAGFALPDAAPFEEWLLLQREELYETRLNTLFTLGSGYLQQGDWSAAQGAAREQVQLESWREKAHRQLIEALARDGQREAAIAQFERCRVILGEEMGIGVSAETQALIDSIRNGTLAQTAASATPTISTNLPTSTTPFIGRDAEIAALVERLLNGDYRLVTLLGQGGIGKTRLSLEVGQRLLASSDLAGVYFVSLVGVDSAENIPTQIAQALDLTLVGQKPIADQVCEQLHNRAQQQPLILILDNFEQLADSPQWLVQLLKSTAGVRLLVTSRERLNLLAEDVVTLSGLSVPASDVPHSKARDYDATRLFVDRARRIEKRFRVTADNWPHLVAICQQLSGLPLGIELTTTWVQEFPLHAVAASIADLDFLETTLHDVAPRQRSMRQVYQASWERLTPAEQEALAQLSVMRGDFTTAAALAVAQTTPMVLRRLRHKSLLQTTGIGWFSLHELVRQFSAEKLINAVATEERHAVYYLGLVSAETDRIFTRACGSAVSHIQANFSNVQRALQTVIRHKLWRTLDDALIALTEFYIHSGRWHELAEFLPPTLRAVEIAEQVPKHLIANLHAQQIYLLTKRKDKTAFDLADRTIQLCANYPYLLGTTHLQIGVLNGYFGNFDAVEHHLQHSLAIGQAHNLPMLVVSTLEQMGHSAFIREQFDTARRYFEQALLVGEPLDNKLVDFLYGQLGGIASEQGEHEKALRLSQTHSDAMRAMGDLHGEGLALHWLAFVQYKVGLYDGAVSSERRAINILQSIGDRELESFAQHTLAEALCGIGQLDEATLAAERAVMLSERSGTTLAQAFAYAALGQARVCCSQFDSARLAFIRAREGFAKVEQASEIRLIDCCLAQIALDDGDVELARRLIEPLVTCAADGSASIAYEMETNGAIVYRVLVANGERELAQNMLTASVASVRKSADKLSDPVIKKAYLSRHHIKALLAEKTQTNESASNGVSIFSQLHQDGIPPLGWTRS